MTKHSNDDKNKICMLPDDELHMMRYQGKCTNTKFSFLWHFLWHFKQNNQQRIFQFTVFRIKIIHEWRNSIFSRSSETKYNNVVDAIEIFHLEMFKLEAKRTMKFKNVSCIIFLETFPLDWKYFGKSKEFKYFCTQECSKLKHNSGLFSYSCGYNSYFWLTHSKLETWGKFKNLKFKFEETNHVVKVPQILLKENWTNYFCKKNRKWDGNRALRHNSFFIRNDEKLVSLLFFEQSICLSFSSDESRRYSIFLLNARF